MNACSNYTVTINGTEEEKAAIAKVMSEAVFEGYEPNMNADGNIIVEDDYGIVWIEDLEDLAVDMAKAAPNASFQMKGYINVENSGEDMDFEITYEDHELTVATSDWYSGWFVEDDMSFEEFCEQCDINPTPESEKEFEKVKNSGERYAYIVPSQSDNVVSEVELEFAWTTEIK